MKLSFIGAGRLATQLAQALHDNGHTITLVYSRTMGAAQALAGKVGAVATDDIAVVGAHLKSSGAEAALMAVKDDVLPSLAARLAEAGGTSCPVFHTAGSVSIDALADLPRHGVIYPMQTFSKERRVDFADVPVFIEASDDESLALALALALSVSRHVSVMDSERRRQLHLAAVFACNFANHCYTLAADILERAGLDFSVMLPLVRETTEKLSAMHPREAQTGPAVRYDQTVIGRQSAMLADMELTQKIYELMSESIHQHSHK